MVEEEPVILAVFHAQPELADAVEEEEVGALQGGRDGGCGGRDGLGRLVWVDEVGDIVEE